MLHMPQFPLDLPSSLPRSPHQTLIADYSLHGLQCSQNHMTNPLPQTLSPAPILTFYIPILVNRHSNRTHTYGHTYTYTQLRLYMCISVCVYMHMYVHMDFFICWSELGELLEFRPSTASEKWRNFRFWLGAWDLQSATSCYLKLVAFYTGTDPLIVILWYNNRE